MIKDTESLLVMEEEGRKEESPLNALDLESQWERSGTHSLDKDVRFNEDVEENGRRNSLTASTSYTRTKSQKRHLGNFEKINKSKQKISTIATL